MNNNLEQVAYYYDKMTELYLQYSGSTLGWHFGLWDESKASTEDPLTCSNRILIENCNLQPGQLVLDAGCGVGGLAFYLAKKYAVKVIGITICQRHVEMATQLAREKGLHHQVEFRLLDFMNLDFQSGYFDFIFNQETFCYVLDREAYLRNIYNILKPGGRWQTVDFFKNDKPLTNEQEEYHCDMQSGWKIPPLSCWSDIQGTLSSIGFLDIYVKDLSKMTVPAALSFVYQGKEYNKNSSQTKSLVNVQEPVFKENVAACVGYSLGLIEGAFTYHLIGGAKKKG